MRKTRKTICIFLFPAVVVFCLIYAYPIVRTILMSFFSIDSGTDKISKWRFMGIQNYISLISTKLFQQSMWNLVRIWFIGGIIVLSFSLLLAVILCQKGIVGKRFFQAIIYLPNIVSAVALATMWLQYVYSPKFGMLKSLFIAIGAKRLADVQWLNSNHKFYAMLFAYCWGMIGYHMLIWIGGIESINSELYEAAEIDGAAGFDCFRYITTPMLKGTLKTNITMWSVSSAGYFLWSQLFSAVTADTFTITPMVYMYMKVFGSTNNVTNHDARVGAAIGVLLSLFVICIFQLTSAFAKDSYYEM